MTAVEFGPVGIALDATTDNAPAEAAELEALGYSAIWLPGGHLHSLDRLADLIGATTRVPVAPAIIPPDVYAANAVATTYAQLERTHPGRLVVGLGSPQQRQQLQPLNHYLDRLNAAEPPVPAGRRILAALGPRKLELARERCAGAVPLLVTTEYTAWAREILGNDSTLIIYQPAVGDTDPHRARQTARYPTLQGLLGVRGYAENMRRMGFGDAEVAQLGDRLVDELVAWGDDAAITERVREHLDAGANHVILGVLDDDHHQPGPADVARRLAHRLVRRWPA